MPLAKQNIPIPFGQGINTKIDPKQLQPGPLTNLQNGIFTVQGLVQKRNGLELFGRDIEISSDIILRGEALANYNNQLLLFTGSKAYSRLSFDEKWADKGNVSSVINSTFQVVRNDYQQENPDVAKVAGLECYVWEDSRGGIRYSIIDAATGNFVLNDKLVSLEGSQPKVLSIADDGTTSAQFVIIWTSDTLIRYTRISIDNLYSSLVAYTLTSDMHEDIVWDACQAVSSVDDAEASCIFITYAARYDSTYVLTNPRTFKIDATAAMLWSYDFVLGTVAPVHIAIAPLADASFSLAAQAGSTCGIMWDDGTDLKFGKIPYYIGPLTSIDISVPIDFHINELEKYAFCWNGEIYTDQISLNVFFEFTQNTDTKFIRAGLLDVFIHGEVFAISVLANLNMKKDVALYSKAFNYNKSSYIMITHVTDLQPTYFLMNSSLEVVSKASQNLAGGHRTSLLAEVIMDDYTLEDSLSVDGYVIGLPVGNGIFKVPTLKKGKLQSETGTIFSRLGVISTSLDFVSNSHFLTADLNDSLHVVGGVLQSYDGNTFNENGFHVYPEDLATTQNIFAVVTTIPGTGVAAEVTDGYMAPAGRIKPGEYWLIWSGLDERAYYVWYRVDGVGTDPEVSGKDPIQVNILSYYTAAQVAEATVAALNLFYVDFSATVVSGIHFNVTRTIPGATTNSTVGTMTSGEINSGTYQYIALWKWLDNQGKIHRSTTSLPEVVTVIGTNKSVTISVPILSLTNKQNVVLEVYRTESLGEIFYKVTSSSSPTFNIVNNDGYYTHVYFVDTVSDADLISNELLYTTGGVLDNDSPPPCSIITTYKNRLFIAGLDDKNVIQYSKISPPDNKDFAAGFSNLFTITLDVRGGHITALSQLDDKLIIFKEKEIYYINGDGPNNTGQGSTYIEPQLITTDVGCENANSVVTTPNGLMFKSSKGIYLLNRGLQVTYVGAAVEEFNDLTISSAVLLNNNNQVRFITEDGVALIYNYYFDQWSTFTNYEAVDCGLFQNSFVLLRTTGETLKEGSGYADGYADGTKHIPLVLETSNFAFAGVNGFQRVYRATLLGEYKGSHSVVVSFAYDYSPVYVDSATFDGYDVIGQYTYGATGPYGATNGNIYGGDYVPYQFRIHLKQQKCTALRMKIEDTQSSPFNEGFNISDLTLQVGIKPSTYKLPANKSLGSD